MYDMFLLDHNKEEKQTMREGYINSKIDKEIYINNLD